VREEEEMSHQPRSRTAFLIETILAVTAAVLFVVTLFWKDWIEVLSGFDPDAHSGAVEWLIPTVLLAVAIGLSLLARAEHRKPARSAT
jgi:hypothetical protein